jgi:hypothetical protein
MLQGASKKGILLNITQLAAELGVSAVFIKRMKWAGFPMPGGRSTIRWALDWLKAHPEFKQVDWTKPRRESGHPPESAADK